MKAQMKAIMASAVVIALCLAAVGGVTYSWFSDTEQSNIDVSTAIVDMDVQFGAPSDNSSITDIVPLGRNVFTLTNLAAGFSGIVPVTSKTNNSTVDTVFMQSITITIPQESELTEKKVLLTEYDAKNITICGKTLYSIIKGDEYTFTVTAGGSYTYEFPWKYVTAGSTFDLEPLSISTPETYGDKTNGGYVLPGEEPYSEPWSHETIKPFTIAVNYKMYQGDYPYAEFDDGNATIPINGAISGEVNYTPTGGESVSIPISVDFSSDNTYTPSEGSSTSVINAVVSAEIDNITGTTVSMNLELKENNQSTTAISNPSFDTPVVISVTVPGDLTNSGRSTPSVIFNGNGEQPTIISYEVVGGKTNITFSVTHFSNYVIGIANVVNSSENIITTSGTYVLNDDVIGSVKVTNNAIAVIDLNGHTLTASTGKHAILNENGYLTIVDSQGSGKVISVSGMSNVKTEKGGVTTIIGGTYYKNTNYYLIKNLGICYILGGTFEGTRACNSMIVNGFQGNASEPAPTDGYKAKMIINGGTFKYVDATNALLKNDEGSDLTVNGGYFKSVPNVLVTNWDVATFNGGIFEADESNSLGLFFNGIWVDNKGTSPASSGLLKITGGDYKFTKMMDGRDYPTMITDTIITGGTFNSVNFENTTVNSFPSDSQYKVTKTDNKVTISKLTA